jgi:glutaminyl-tRNA synthetase
MKAGEFSDGEHVLRAKIDMAHPNMIMRDPPIYRIKHATHHRTGDDWCIYPMYDFAHCLEDAIEGVTHSICTLEFESNREFYDWVLDNGPAPSRPRQYEFARLGLDYTVMSKRMFRELVDGRHVAGWDDPRMPTLAGLRRRGIRPEAIRAFCDLIGVAKNNSTVDIGKLEYCVRDDLNHSAPRAMAVLDPLKVVLTNYPEGEVESLTANDWPHDVPREGTREVPFSRELYVERGDFAAEPEKGWYRLAPGAEVRLRYAYVIRCEEAVTDRLTGEVTELRCTYDPDTRGGTTPDGRKVRGTIHWVSAAHARPVTVRLYDRLFDHPAPDGDRSVDFKTHLNPESLVVVDRALVEPSLGEAKAGARYQFERNGYFIADALDSRDGAPVFNRIITLKDTWARQSAGAEVAASQPTPRVRRQRERGEGGRAEAATRIDTRQALRDERPELAARYDLYKDQIGLSHEQADLLTSDLALAEFYDAACADTEAAATSVASWVVNELLREVKDRSLAELPFDAAAFGSLVKLVDDGIVSRAAGKSVLEAMVESGGDPEALVESLGLAQMSDEDALVAAVDTVIAGAADEVARYRGGDRKLLGFFMGAVMKETGGKANPQVVRELLADRLG